MKVSIAMNITTKKANCASSIHPKDLDGFWIKFSSELGYEVIRLTRLNHKDGVVVGTSSVTNVECLKELAVVIAVKCRRIEQQQPKQKPRTTSVANSTAPRKALKRPPLSTINVQHQSYETEGSTTKRRMVARGTGGTKSTAMGKKRPRSKRRRNGHDESGKEISRGEKVFGQVRVQTLWNFRNVRLQCHNEGYCFAVHVPRWVPVREAV